MSSARTTFSNIYVSHNAGVAGALSVGGNAGVAGALSVGGNTSLTGTVAFGGDVSLGSNLSVAGETTLTGNVSVTGTLDVLDIVNVDSEFGVTITTGVSVSGGTQLSYTLIADDLDVSGTVTSNVTNCNTDLEYQGSSLLPGAVLDPTLTMTGVDESFNPVLVEGSVAGVIKVQFSMGTPTAGGLGKIAQVFISGMSGTIYATGSVSSLDLVCDGPETFAELVPNDSPNIPVMVINGDHVVPGMLYMSQTVPQWSFTPLWNGTANSDSWAANAACGILPTTFSYYLDKGSA